MNINNIVTAICSLLFFMIGVDKFLPFLDPPCSLSSNIPPSVWKVFGGLQLAAGILIWHPRSKKFVAGFFIIFMLVFTIYHLKENTYDIGGSSFMAFMLGLLIWNPRFFRGKNK